MIPQRFATEYPERCLALLDAAEDSARNQDLLASFALLAAASVLVMPYERLKSSHPIQQTDQLSLSGELRALEKQYWREATFWQGQPPGDWHLARVMDDPNRVSGWCDENREPSVSPTANRIDKKRAGEVLRVLRNALAHGNIVYLNEQGREEPGTPVRFLAFLSRYEETEVERRTASTFRVVIVSDEEFLRFIRLWACWLATLPKDNSLTEAP